MSTVEAVDIERVIASASALGITLHPHETHPIASAEVNGYSLTVAALGSTVVVRADALSDIATDAGNPALHMAANHMNSTQVVAKAVVLDGASTLISRTETEIMCAAGLSEEQLNAALRASFDGVILVHDAVREIASQA